MDCVVFFGGTAASPERMAAEDLARDLEAVIDRPVAATMEPESIPADRTVFLVGTPASCRALAATCEREKLSLTPQTPGPRGGLMRRVERPGQPPIVLLGGSDAGGVQRVVYTYAREILGIDPFAWWTGKKPRAGVSPLPETLDRIVASPTVPIVCYFDNDNDELANMSRPYLQFDFETWKALVDSLVRIGYNAIDIHDHLGRSEFYRWDFYKQLRPDYMVDLDFLDKMIDYAHQKGVMIQIPMYLAWQFKHIGEDEAVCWTKYQDRWREVWRYYMKETPLGKGDLFLDRPRSQLWDYDYRSACGEDTATVMTEAFTALRDIVRESNPNATMICDLYTHGMEVWRTGRFNPPKDYIMAWPNDGWGRISGFPEDTRGYRFGCYMHAGFWLNHVVEDPYPERIGDSMRRMLVDHDARHYLLVNGQTFRHFGLNLEAYARASADPEGFSGTRFYREYATRYVGETAAPKAVEALRVLHEVSGRGYVDFMHALMRDLEACVQKKRFDSVAELMETRAGVAQQHARLLDALQLAQDAEALTQTEDAAMVAYDQFVLPIRIFAETVAIRLALLDALIGWNRYCIENNAHGLEQARAAVVEARKRLELHLATRAEGDRNPQWKTWYDPAKRRPNGGFPTMEELDRVQFEESEASAK